MEVTESQARLQVPKNAKACGACRVAHTACDSKRPCGRCVTLGRPEECCDVKMKKRGRPRKNQNILPGEGEAMLGTASLSDISAPVSDEKKAKKRRRTPGGKATAGKNRDAFAPHASHTDARITQIQSPSHHHSPFAAAHSSSTTSPSQWTPLRPPPSPNFPTLPIPSLFNQPAGRLDHLSIAASALASSGPSSSSSSASSASNSATPSSAAPLPSGADVLPAGPTILPASRSTQPLFPKPPADHARSSHFYTSPPQHPQPTKAVTDSLLSLLIEEMRDLRENNRDIRNQVAELRKQQMRYEQQQMEILRRLDALIARSDSVPVRPDNSLHQDKSRRRLSALHDHDYDESYNSTAMSPERFSSSAELLDDILLTTSRPASSISSASSSVVDYSLTSSAIVRHSSDNFASIDWPKCMYLGPNLPSPKTWPRLPASEIVAHIPFLSCYDLDNSEYPFVIDDFRKPAAVCRMMKLGDAPLLVYVNKAFCDATGYSSQELLGYPIEKVSLPDYKTKASIVPHYFAESPPPLSVHIPARPVCLPKHGRFIRVFVRHQILYNRQSKPVWVAFCVDGQEEGTPVIDLGLPEGIFPSHDHSIEAYLRSSHPRSVERACQYMGSRILPLVKSARIVPPDTLGTNSECAPDGEESDNRAAEQRHDAPNRMPSPSFESSPSHSSSFSSSSSESPFSPMQPPSPLYPFSPASPSLDDLSWLLRGDNPATPRKELS